MSNKTRKWRPYPEKRAVWVDNEGSDFSGYFHVRGVTEEEIHLIAAAPDLLTESEKALEILVDLQNNHLYSAAAVTRALVQKRIDALKAALAKVQG